jgi:hypothetical protein
MTTDLDSMAKEIESAKQFAEFAAQFAAEVRKSPDEWSNTRLSTFLEEIDNWISSSIEYPDSVGYRILSEPPSWKSFAMIMLAAA